jgi:hypothetical protein
MLLPESGIYNELWFRNWKKRGNLEDISTDGRIILIFD